MLLELFKIFIGVISGTLVYVITKFILDNILQQRVIIGKITYALVFYANVYSSHMSKETDLREASKKFRELASSLSTNNKIIPFYIFCEKLRIVYNKSDIDIVIRELIGLSNGCLGLINVTEGRLDTRINNNETRVNNIINILNISFPK